MAKKDAIIEVKRNIIGVVNVEPNAEVNQTIYNTITPNE